MGTGNWVENRYWGKVDAGIGRGRGGGRMKAYCDVWCNDVKALVVIFNPLKIQTVYGIGLRKSVLKEKLRVNIHQS